MIQSSSEQLRACYERAGEAKRKAEETTDPVLKSDFLDIERRWLGLASGYTFSEGIGDVAAGPSERRHRADEPNDVTLYDALRLQEISILLLHDNAIEALYGRLLDVVINLMSADMGSMQELAPDRGDLRLLAWKGFHPDSAAFWEWVHLDSASTCGQALSSGRRVIVSDIEECEWMAGSTDQDAYRRSGIRAVQSTPLLSRSGRLLGMMSTHWRHPHRPGDHALRLLDVLARQAADLIDRAQAEAALRESEARCRRLAHIVESSDDAIFSIYLDGTVSSWNKGAERLFGYTAAEAVGNLILFLVPANRQQEETALLARITSGESVAYDAVRRRKDGTLVDISLTVSPLKDAAGRVIGGCKIARDITERKRAEARLRTLSREVDHRARNLLALVQATVHMSNAASTSELKSAIEGRIQALAKTHTLLANSRWTGAELGTLVREELSPYDSQEASRTSVTGPDFLLNPEQAQSLSMVLHELATNAVKYGALSVPAGSLRVHWVDHDDGRFLFHWTEVGGPPVEPPRRRGFGARVIEQLVRQQLKGEARFDWRPEGLVCEIAFPVEGRSVG